LSLDGDATLKSEGKGNAGQTAELTGAISVTISEVLPNGNLVIRGEKQLALSEGSEFIQVAGIVRPEDVAPDGSVQSRRLANAQIAYRGTGELANASRGGWGTQLLNRFWPF
jgi:flagellar L-ring protein precursor FlgH